MENNSIIKSGNQPTVPLTPAKQTAIQRWTQQPMQYYRELPISTMSDMIQSDSPTLWDIRNHTDNATAIGLLVKALIYTARLVNVENNLTEDQIGEIANDVLNEMGYLKMEEVKHILKTAVRTKKIYARLDYNVVMGWFEQYDSERTEEAIRISDRKAQIAQMEQPSEDGITFEQYAELLRQRADSGDKSAQERLKQIEAPSDIGIHCVSREQRKQRDDEFKTFYSKYIIDKHKCQDSQSS